MGENCEERRGEFSDGGEIGRARIGVAGENLVGGKSGRKMGVGRCSAGSWRGNGMRREGERKFFRERERGIGKEVRLSENWRPGLGG